MNRAWKDFAKANAGGQAPLNEGVNYCKVCDSAQGLDLEEAVAFGAGLRAVLEGQQAEFRLEYPCHSPVQYAGSRTGSPAFSARTSGPSWW